MDGPVPQLRIGDLIGRRRELREALHSLRDPGRQHAGVVLTGIGGAGKSALAGRVMARLAEGGWLVAAHRGRFDLAAIGVALGAVLLQSDRAPSRRLGEQLVRADLDDRVRLAFLGQVLAEERILLVLDDFEDNLQAGGGAFLDEDAATYLRFLAERARSGRLLITSRYPVPGFDAYLRRIPIGPLSVAETRKLVLRLPGLAAIDASAVADVLRLTVGHPRVLEFLDALMRGGAGRFPAVTEKIQKIVLNKDYNLNAGLRSSSDAVQEAIALAAGDIVLEQLLDIAHREGCADILLQAAISNLPVPPQGIPRMLAEDPASAPAVPATIDAALARLESLSLLHRFPSGDVWVHRWTAEALRRLDDPAAHTARAVRAGYYRLWRVQNESHDLGDAIEAIRNFLLGEAFDEAVATAQLCFDALRRFEQSVGIAAWRPKSSTPCRRPIADLPRLPTQEAQAHLALGQTGRALARTGRCSTITSGWQRPSPIAPTTSATSRYHMTRMGDLFSALGQGEDGPRGLCQGARHQPSGWRRPSPIAPTTSATSRYHTNRMGDLYQRPRTGRGRPARPMRRRSPSAERLAKAEPDRADYQRDLSVSYNKNGRSVSAPSDRARTAREAYAKALAIARAAGEAPSPIAPTTSATSRYHTNRMGDLYRRPRTGRGRRARPLPKRSPSESGWRSAEPDRADYQRDLSVSYNEWAISSRARARAKRRVEAYAKVARHL